MSQLEIASYDSLDDNKLSKAEKSSWVTQCNFCNDILKTSEVQLARICLSLILSKSIEQLCLEELFTVAIKIKNYTHLELNLCCLNLPWDLAEALGSFFRVCNLCKLQILYSIR
ncbi:hypothetical protein P5673_015550 [Acropora cervicornis]|uniref:Uncharacterized protein n=1 Tax=Acropora cervicornis TaxID=6130 RepID=A0AAD9QHR7_ACRCE|nr:hypothetical protein P5673_015550 [Acropora cervicornis]